MAVRARKYEKMMKKEQMERQRKVEEDMKDKVGSSKLCIILFFNGCSCS